MMQFFLLQNTLLVIFIIVGFWCSKRKNVYPIIVIAILLYTIISVFKHQHLNISIQVDNILDNIHILHNYM